MSDYSDEIIRRVNAAPALSSAQIERLRALLATAKRPAAVPLRGRASRGNAEQDDFVDDVDSPHRNPDGPQRHAQSAR